MKKLFILVFSFVLLFALNLQAFQSEWLMEEGSGSYAKNSLPNYDLKLNEVSIVNAGNIKSLYFPGGNSRYAQVQYLPDNFIFGFTYIAWVNISSISDWQRLFDFGTGPGNNLIVLHRNAKTNGLIYVVGNGSEIREIRTDENVLTTGEWMMLAVTHDKSGNVKIYKNGEIIKTGNLWFPVNASRKSSYIGKSNWPNEETYHGYMKNIRVIDIVLSDNEIKNSYFNDLNNFIKIDKRKSRFPDPDKQNAVFRIEMNDESKSFPLNNSGNGGLKYAYNNGCSFVKHKNVDLLEFDGVNNYVDIGPVSEDFSKGYTFNVWAYIDLYGSRKWARFFDIGCGAQFNNILLARRDLSNDLSFHIYDGGRVAAELNAPNILEERTWMMLTVTHAPNGAIKLYKNGALIASGNGEIAKSGIRTCAYLGKSNWQSDQFFKGKMWDFSMYARPLSQQEITNLFNTGNNKLNQRINYEAEWITDKVAGSKINNSKNSGDLKLYNISENSDQGITSMHFAGNGQYAEVDKLPDDFSQGLTFICWNYTMMPTNYQRFFDFGNGMGNDNIILQRNALTEGLTYIVFNGNNPADIKTGDILKRNEWAMYAVTQDKDGSVIIYKNGEMAVSGKISLPVEISRKNAYIGKSNWPNEQTFSGNMKNIRLFNRALTKAEIQNYYANDLKNNFIKSNKKNSVNANLNEPRYKLTMDDAHSSFTLINSGVSGPELIQHRNCQYAKFGATNVLEFPGSGNNNINLSPFLEDLSNGYTFNLWTYIEPTNEKRWARFFDIGSGAENNNILLARRDTSNDLSFMIFKDNRIIGDVNITNVLEDRKWLMFTVVQDAQGNIKIYKNGLMIGEGKSELPKYVIRTSAYLGYSNWPSDNDFKGKMSDFSMYAKPLTNKEILDLYVSRNQKFFGAPLKNNDDNPSSVIKPEHRWRFNEGNENLSYNTGNSDRALNTALYNCEWDNTKKQPELKFNGENSYADLGIITEDLSKGFTINVMTYIESNKTWARFVDIGCGQANNNILLAREGTTNNLTMHIYHIGNVVCNITANNALEEKKWIMLTASIDERGNAALYKNGKKIASGNYRLPNNIIRTSCFAGKSNWWSDQYFHGRMGEVSIFSRCLTDVEIGSLYDPTEDAVKNDFDLQFLNIANLKKQGGKITAEIGGEFNLPLNEADVTLTIPKTTITFDKINTNDKSKYRDMSGLLEKNQIEPTLAFDCNFNLFNADYTGKISYWKDAVKGKFLAFKINKELDLLNNQIINKLNLPLDELPLLDELKINDMEIILDIKTKQVVLYFNIVVNGRATDFYIYNSKLNSYNSKERKVKQSFNLTMLIDFGMIPVRDIIQKLLGMSLDAGQIDGAALVLSMKSGDCQVKDLSVLIQKPYMNLYNDLNASLTYVQGLNIIAALNPKNMGIASKAFEQLNINTRGNLVVQGSAKLATVDLDKDKKGKGADRKEEDKKDERGTKSRRGSINDKRSSTSSRSSVNDRRSTRTSRDSSGYRTSENSRSSSRRQNTTSARRSVRGWDGDKSQTYPDESKDSSRDSKDDKDKKKDSKYKDLEVTLGCHLPEWQMPQVFRNNFDIVQGVQPQFFIRVVTEAVTLGVSVDFRTKIGQEEQILSGAVEATILESGVNAGLRGSMTGVVAAPFDIPFAIEDPVVKVTASPDLVFSFGITGITHLSDRAIDLGGNIKVKYVGKAVVPQAGAFKADVNKVKLKDIADITNTAIAICERKWQPWQVPNNPIVLPDGVNIELEDAHFEFVTPGAADPSLKFNKTGVIVRGNLIYNNEYLGILDIAADKTGFIGMGQTKAMSFNGIDFDGVMFDAVAKITEKPRFLAKTSLKLGSQTYIANANLLLESGANLQLLGKCLGFDAEADVVTPKNNRGKTDYKNLNATIYFKDDFKRVIRDGAVNGINSILNPYRQYFDKIDAINNFKRQKEEKENKINELKNRFGNLIGRNKLEKTADPEIAEVVSDISEKQFSYAGLNDNGRDFVYEVAIGGISIPSAPSLPSPPSPPIPSWEDKDLFRRLKDEVNNLANQINNANSELNNLERNLKGLANKSIDLFNRVKSAADNLNIEEISFGGRVIDLIANRITNISITFSANNKKMTVSNVVYDVNRTEQSVEDLAEKIIKEVIRNCQ